MVLSTSPGAFVAASPRANRGRLNNGNPPGDYMAAPRCGAKTRLGGGCAQPAMGNGRCRFHGGKSTGARTAAGRARCARARRTHGFYSAEIVALRREARAAHRRMQGLVAALRGRPDRPAGHGVLPSNSGRRVPDGRTPRPAGRSAMRRPALSVLRPPSSSILCRPPAGHGVLPSLLRSALRRAAGWLGLRPADRT